MTTVYDMLQRVKQAKDQFYDIVTDVASNEALNLTNLNRQQLMEGEGNDDKPLQVISQDPYFKGNTTRAAGYARMKRKLTPQTPYDRANLYINGYTHDNMGVTAEGRKLIWTVQHSFSEALAAKYRNRHLGLNSKFKVIAWNKYLRNPTIDRIANITGMRVSY